jgi:ATP/maltotriose-dependent transcriptional regulator MalT
MSGSALLADGWAALDRADWETARAAFADADESAEALEGLSRAAWWLGDEQTTFDARERAYRAFRAAGDVCGAARMAMWLGSDHLDFRGEHAVALGWLQQARAVLGDHPPCQEAGWITLLEADIAVLAEDDPARAERGAREALALAEQLEDGDLQVVALAILGTALMTTDAVDEGLRCLDRAAALTLGEQFEEPAAAGWALCHTVSACAAVGDFARASQWCRVLHSWSADWRARHFFGICRTAYGEVLSATGDWPSAEEELTSAIEDMRVTRPALAAPGAVRLGQLRMRQGNLAAARELFESALPFPGAVIALGELALAEGDAVRAVEAAERVLRRLGDATVLDRFPALELLARARAAAGDLAGALACADEIEREAERFGTPYMRGRGRLAVGHVRLTAGDLDLARQAAEDAVDLFSECRAPYEAARARVILASTLECLGRPERASEEALAADETFALLGARRQGGYSAAADELSPREVDILRLVARGLSDAQIAGHLFLSPHTVHRHVANIRTKLRTPSRAAAVAYATQRGLL